MENPKNKSMMRTVCFLQSSMGGGCRYYNGWSSASHHSDQTKEDRRGRNLHAPASRRRLSFNCVEGLTMTSLVMPNTALLQDDNVPIHTAKNFQSWFEDHQNIFRHLPWAVQSADPTIPTIYKSILRRIIAVLQANGRPTPYKQN